MTTIQKNNTVKILFSVLVSSLLFSCQEELVDGNRYQQTYDPQKAPACQTDSVVAVHAYFARLCGQVQSVDTLLDCGIMISEQADFSHAIFAAAPTENGAFDLSFHGLKDSTTYYFRSYAVNPTGGGAYGSTKQFTTPKGQEYLRVTAESGPVEEWDTLQTIDQDGDGYGWDFIYTNTSKTQGYYSSYSWNGGALFPENYLLLPPYDLAGVHARMELTIYPSSPNYFAESFQVVASTNPITTDNCRLAEVIHQTNFTNPKVSTIGIDIPDHYLGGKIYLGIVHNNCSDNDALILTGIAVYCDK
jgi:hypothetical protein